MKTVLSIAGSDPSGGAGIQADIKTLTVNGIYAMTAVTALTAQNTQRVTGISEVSPEFLEKQIDAVFEDIRPDAVKVGMVFSASLIRKVASCLKKYKAENIVIDTPITASSGARLLEEEALKTLKEDLLPLAALITPNLDEAGELAGLSVKTKDDMLRAAEKISVEYGCDVLLKGGHSADDPDDLLYRKDGTHRWFKGRRIDNKNTHGTGCTLSSAIAADLAKGYDVEEAVALAKEYLTEALASGLDLGEGSGPINHAYMLTDKKEGINKGEN